MLINDIPVEVFIRIVDTWFTIEDAESSMKESSSRYGLTFINHLRRVCKRWREVIDSETTFWTHIQLGGEGTSDNAPTVATKLTKSGAAGLNIKYNTNTDCAGDTNAFGADFQAFVELFERHADRWKSMQIHATWAEHRELLPILRVQRFPKLELIMVESLTYGSRPIQWSFKGCPKLHTLVVDRHPLPKEIGGYGQLKRLEIRDHVRNVEKFS